MSARLNYLSHSASSVFCVGYFLFFFFYFVVLRIFKIGSLKLFAKADLKL
jgi:hypothetical protein